MVIAEVLLKYKNIIDEKFEQYLELKRKGDLKKAGEVIWSILVIMISMISLVLKGEPISRHKEAKLFVKKELSILYHNLYRDDPKHLVLLFNDAEKLHTNFYLDFLDENELYECLGASEKLVTILWSFFKYSLEIKRRRKHSEEHKGRKT